MPSTIKVLDISKRLGKNQALSRVSTVFEEKKLHGLIGAEGAGKTTLLRMLIGLLHPDTGNVEYLSDGSSVSLDSMREKISYMPSRQNLYPDLSVSEHLDFFKAMYKVPKAEYVKRREELLHITRLEKFSDRKASKLSGGKYKKLGLMCALLQSPQILLLDEPTNGVDPISRREFWELLYRLLKEEILIVISTSYMDEAERCSVVHLMEEGRLIESGEPADLLSREGVKNFDEYFLKKGNGGKA